MAFAMGLAAFSQTVDPWRDLSPHKSAVVEANGIHLHYLDWGGAGEAMIFLAGLGNNAHVFDGLAPKFADRFHAIAMTRRGFGQSDRPDTGYDVPARVADVAGFLDALHIEKAILVGHSLAGDELTGFALAHPKRVLKLVYLDAAYDRSQMPKDTGKAQQALAFALLAHLKLPPDLSLVERDIAIAKLRFGSMWPNELEADIRENYIRASDGTLKHRPFPPVQALMDGTMKANLDASKLTRPALSFFAINDALEGIAADKRNELESFAQQMNAFRDAQIETMKKNSNVRVIVMPDTNHYCWFDKPDQVLREMNAFLK